MKIAIIGYGYVGKAFAKLVRDHHEVLIYDPQYESVSKEEINQCDLGVICVPTPMDKTKEFPYPCDTSLVEETVSWLETPVILIKSTVAIGTTKKLKERFGKRICMSPEYVGESRYYLPEDIDYKDMKKPQWVILGGEQDDVNYILDILVPILGPMKDYYTCSETEAEIIKYMENTGFALTNNFVQMMYDICKSTGVDWYKVWQGWGLDRRVNKIHTAVYPNNRGFGGKCFPKDVNALARYAKDNGHDARLLMTMLETNKEYRERSNVDCEYNEEVEKKEEIKEMQTPLVIRSKDRPKIALMVDIIGWAYDQTAKMLMRYLKDDFKFFKFPSGEADRVDLSQFDIVHNHGFRPDYFPKEQISKIQRYTMALNSDRSIDQLKKDYQFEIIKNASGIVTMNNKFYRYAKKLNDNVVQINNGVDMTLFYPNRSEYLPDRFVVGFSGNIKDNFKNNLKGYSKYVVPACEKAGVELDTLSYGVKQLPLEKMPIWYNRINCLVSASSTEGDSQTINSAMACKTPILATKVGSLVKYGKDRENVLFIKRDVNDIAKKITEIRENHKLREKIANGGYDLIMKHHNPEEVTQQYKEFWLNILDKGENETSKVETKKKKGL